MSIAQVYVGFQGSQVSAWAEESSKWRKHKRSSLEVAAKMRRAGLTGRAARMERCGDLVIYDVCPVCGSRHVRQVERCRDRVCPLCQWRLSIKRYVEMCQTMTQVDMTGLRPYFVTLTQRNAEALELRGQLHDMARAWNRLHARRTIRPYLPGWARSLEITYNAEAGTFHPHYHAIVLSKIDLDTKDWRAWWRDALGLDYDPICDCRPVRLRPGSDLGAMADLVQGSDRAQAAAISSAILEAYKYAVKPEALRDMPLGDFRLLLGALASTKQVSYGGVIKAARAALSLSDTDDSDLDDESGAVHQCESCGADMMLAALRWSASSEAYDVVAWLLTGADGAAAINLA